MPDYYPYTWNADEIEILSDIRFGVRDVGPYRGVHLLHYGDMVWLQRRTDALGFPLGRVQGIRMLKRGRWWDLPVQGRRVRW